MIKPKFNIGDEVWIYDDKPIQTKVIDVSVWTWLDQNLYTTDHEPDSNLMCVYQTEAECLSASLNVLRSVYALALRHADELKQEVNTIESRLFALAVQRQSNEVTND